MVPIPTGALVLLVGPPGSGKSTFARRLVDDGIVAPGDVLSTDDLRHELVGSAADLTGDRRVFVELRRRLIPRMAAGRTTVVDATNLWPGRRGRHIRVAKEHRRPVVAVVLTAPLEVLLARNTERERTVPPGAVVVMHRQAEALDDETLLAEGCDVVLRAEPPATALMRPGARSGSRGRTP